ncbi:hypothetical protein ACFE04_011117 [Oxalis oulophora]
MTSFRQSGELFYIFPQYATGFALFRFLLLLQSLQHLYDDFVNHWDQSGVSCRSEGMVVSLLMKSVDNLLQKLCVNTSNTFRIANGTINGFGSTFSVPFLNTNGTAGKNFKRTWQSGRSYIQHIVRYFQILRIVSFCYKTCGPASLFKASKLKQFVEFLKCEMRGSFEIRNSQNHQKRVEDRSVHTIDWLAVMCWRDAGTLIVMLPVDWNNLGKFFVFQNL